MKNSVRLAVVVAMAMGLVATVIQLERTYVPHKPAEWHTWLAAPPSEEAFAPIPDSGVVAAVGATVSKGEATSKAGRGEESAAANTPATTGHEADRSQSASSSTGVASPPPGRFVEAAKVQPLSKPVASLPVASKADDENPDNPIRSISLDQRRADRNARDEERKLRSSEMEDLIRQLANADEEVARRARAELSLRGFSDVELDVARNVVDADPDVRQQVARALPRLQSVDAGPWLLWLSRDENRDVRLTAITLLATTGDPNLLEQLEGIVGRDPDPQIREQLERITQQLQSIGSRVKPTGRRR